MSHQFPSMLLRLSHVADYLIDNQVGIVHAVNEFRAGPGAPNFFHFTAQLGDTRALCRQRHSGMTHGASTVREAAAARALSDAVALYCSAYYDVTTMPASTRKAAKFHCVSPHDFALYTREQCEQSDFPFTFFDDDTPLTWMQAVDPATDETCYVPSAMVFLPFNVGQAPEETPIIQPTATGLACHLSPAAAAVAAICDVVLGDSLMLTWQARMARPHIRIETLSDLNYELVSRFEQTSGSVTLIDLTLDLEIPTVLSVLRGAQGGAPALVFSAATDLNPEFAVQKSLEELALTLRHSRQIKTYAPRLVPEPNHTNIIDQNDHLNFWCDEANASLADFIYASPERIEFEDMKNQATGDPQSDLQVLLDKAGDSENQILLVDLTTSDIEDLGLAVVKAVVPGLHPLFMGYQNRALGGSRLWEVPHLMGCPGISGESGDNRAPHPFYRKGTPE